MFIDIPFTVLRDSVIVIAEIVIWLLHSSVGILIVKRPDTFDVADKLGLGCGVFICKRRLQGWSTEHVLHAILMMVDPRGNCIIVYSLAISRKFDR